MFPAHLEQPPSVLASRATAGPRYTSYPPATQFTGDFGAADARAELAALAPDAPVSLYAHVPFCSQLCWYCGCNVTATRDRSRGSEYVDVLERELAILGAAIGAHPLAELALGGGSPNFLRDADMTRLVASVYRHFRLTGDAELGCELDPRDTRESQIDLLADLGFTRLSVGVQDFDPEVQAVIHRLQSIAQTRAVLDRARARGFRSVNVDLVYGLPGQTPATLARTLEAVIAMRPNRVAVFGYAHLPHLRPHQRLIERAAPVPDLLARANLLAAVMDHLADAGYVRIGLDHFALPDDPLVAAAREGRLHRNFQGYVARRIEPLIGIGPSAISDSGGAYWQNAVEVDDWQKRVLAGELPVARGVRLDDDDRLRRFVITRLMCDGRVERAEVEQKYGISFAERFAKELAALAKDQGDLVRISDDAIAATGLGHQLIRNVARVFDRYAKEGAGGSPTI